MPAVPRSKLRIASTRIIPVATAATLTATALFSSGAAHSATSVFATRPGVMQRWAGAHMANDKSTVTQAQALAAAKNFDVIVVSGTEMAAYETAMHQANPNLKTLVYINGTFTAGANDYPDSWYAHDAHGNKIRSGNFGNYLMDASNANWVNQVPKNCAAARAISHADGCYMDMLGTAPLLDAYVSSVPVNPSTGQAWDLDAYVKATCALAQNVAAVDHVITAANGIANGSRYFRTPGSSKPLLFAVNAGHAEIWLRGAGDPAGKFKDVKHWLNDVNMLADAGNSGGVVLAMTKLWVNASPAQVTQWHKYALASFLLGTNGTSYFTFTAGRSLANAIADNPWDRVQVGTPQGAYQATSGGAYIRHFTSGVAVVNPGTSTTTVQLGGSYTNLEGVTESSVTLPANSGEVFVR